MTGISYQLRPEFVAKISRHARRYERATQAGSKVQWQIGRAALEEWRFVEQDAEGEITKGHFQAWVSSTINQKMGYPLLTDSGETLRRWMDIAECYENVELNGLDNKLPYDWFRIARSLSKRPENEAKGYAPEYIIAKVYAEQWTEKEMLEYFGDGSTPPHEYDQAIGWLDGLAGAKFAWVKDAAARKRIGALIRELRGIIEAQR